MDFLLEALTNWLKEMLVGGIMSNLSGMFDSVNQQVADISVQVGQTPQGWNGSIFSMIENLSNSIMVPIAGVILAIVMTVEPGFAGQKFMPDAVGRLEELQKLKEKTNTDFLISIDGGIDKYHSAECMKRGAEILVSGIYTVFRQPEGLEKACESYQKEMEKIQKEAGF